MTNTKALNMEQLPYSYSPFYLEEDISCCGVWDVGITLDVIEMAAHTDVIILLSGDGDFDLLLNKVKQSTSATTEVYGVSALTAQSLSNAADRFIAITPSLLL